MEISTLVLLTSMKIKMEWGFKFLSMAIFMLETINKTYLKVMESIIGQVVLHIMAILLLEWDMAQVCGTWSMEIVMKVNILMTRNQVMEFILGPMEIDTKDTLKMITGMVMGKWFGAMGKLSKGNGLMAYKSIKLSNYKRKVNKSPLMVNWLSQERNHFKQEQDYWQKRNLKKKS